MGAVVRSVPTLGPIIEKVIDATDGEVVLVKVNVDENPGDQPGVPGAVDPRRVRAEATAQVVDGFVGAYPEHEVKRFVRGLLPTEEENEVAPLLAAGDEGSLRQVLELEPGNEDAIVGPRRAARRARRRPTRRWRCWSASRSPIAPGKVAAAARVGTRPAGRLRRHARPAARPGEGRRRGPSGVRRHPRADGPRRPATADYRRKLTAQLF